MTNTLFHTIIFIRSNIFQTMLQYFELAANMYQQAAVQSIAGDACEGAHRCDHDLVSEGKQKCRRGRVIVREPRSKRQFSDLEICEKRSHQYTQ